jgi:hypothetical protein
MGKTTAIWVPIFNGIDSFCIKKFNIDMEVQNKSFGKLFFEKLWKNIKFAWLWPKIEKSVWKSIMNTLLFQCGLLNFLAYYFLPLSAYSIYSSMRGALFSYYHSSNVHK